MQNPSDMVRSWRTCPSRPRTHKGSRGKSRRDSRKAKSSPVPTKELCGQEKAGNKFQPRRFRVSQGIAYSRNPNENNGYSDARLSEKKKERKEKESMQPKFSQVFKFQKRDM